MAYSHRTVCLAPCSRPLIARIYFQTRYFVMTLAKKYSHPGRLLSSDAQTYAHDFFRLKSGHENVSRIEKSPKIGLKLTISYIATVPSSRSSGGKGELTDFFGVLLCGVEPPPVITTYRDGASSISTSSLTIVVNLGL